VGLNVAKRKAKILPLTIAAILLPSSLFNLLATSNLNRNTCAPQP